MYFLFQKSINPPSSSMLNLGMMYFCQQLIKLIRPAVKHVILTLSCEGNSIFYVEHSNAFQLLFLNTTVTCRRNACTFYLLSIFIKALYCFCVEAFANLSLIPSSESPCKLISHFQNCILQLGPLPNLVCKTRKWHFSDMLVVKKEDFLALYGKKKVYSIFLGL